MRGSGQVGSLSFSQSLHTLTSPIPEPTHHTRLCLLRSDPDAAGAKTRILEQDAQHRGGRVCQCPRYLGNSWLLWRLGWGVGLCWLLQSPPGHRVMGRPGGLDSAHLKGDILGETMLGTLTPSETWRLLRIPSGCPEQTLSSLTPVVILTRYLDTTGQWDKVGVELRQQVMKNLASGESGSPPGTLMRASESLRQSAEVPLGLEEAPTGPSQTIAPKF